MIPLKHYPIIAGPTASGKTALAIALAKHINGEVVSADSMQIYDTVSVGTARPSIEEMDGVTHHLMGFLPLTAQYSVASYLTDAHNVFEDIYRRGCTPVMCGGTGLYIQSFMENRQLLEEQPDPAVREHYIALADSEGNEALMQRLRLVDPVAAARLHINDRNRIIRALEVYDTTGITITEQAERSHAIPSPYTPCLFILDFHNRQALYDRINLRVTHMLNNGLLDEAQQVLSSNPEATVTQAIGYKEFLPYFRGEISLDEAVDKLRQQTRRYAKRQLSWFHRMEGAITIWVDEHSTQESLIAETIRQYEIWWKGVSAP